MNEESLVDNNAENISRCLWQGHISFGFQITRIFIFIYLQKLIAFVMGLALAILAPEPLKNIPFLVLIFFVLASWDGTTWNVIH